MGSGLQGLGFRVGRFGGFEFWAPLRVRIPGTQAIKPSKSH